MPSFECLLFERNLRPTALRNASARSFFFPSQGEVIVTEMSIGSKLTINLAQRIEVMNVGTRAHIEDFSNHPGAHPEGEYRG